MKFQFFCKGALAAVILGCSALPTLAQAPALGVLPASGVLPKKLIELGWDKPDTARLRANLKEMEKAPFDGVIIGVTGKNDEGNLIHAAAGFSKTPWKREWFGSGIADLKAIRSKKLTDNFIQLGANPGDVDWFDDAGWKVVVEHWRTAAWIAKEGGLKGILFDPEPYAKPFSQFNYQAQPEREKHTLGEYQVKARQRGREVMRAISSEAPDLVLFTLFMNSVNAPATLSTNPQVALATLSYNLYPAFIDGWMDEAPPAMTFVDGSETSYLYNSQLQYVQGANDMHNSVLSLVAPENRRKYSAQVQASFGMYLDAYVNPASNQWYVNPEGEEPVARLRANTSYAIRAANEYVWVYGEKYRWWPTPNKGVNAESWDEKMPGTSMALTAAVHPQRLAEMTFAELDKPGAPANMIQNGDFPIMTAATKAPAVQTTPADWNTPAGIANWNTWQTTNSRGIFQFDKTTNHSAEKNSGSAQITGAEGGCFIQYLPAKPGETYAVRTWFKQKGESPGWIRVRWQTSENKWTSEQQDVLLMPTPGQNINGWQELSGLVTVPASAGRIVLLLSVANQSKEDSVWFDDAQLFKIG